MEGEDWTKAFEFKAGKGAETIWNSLDCAVVQAVTRSPFYTRRFTSAARLRVDTRAGSYERQLETKAGEVTLRVPKLRTLPFESAIIDRHRRRESSVEEALLEMYLELVS